MPTNPPVEPKKKVRKFRLMSGYGKHTDSKGSHAPGDVVTVEYDDYAGDPSDEEAKNKHHDPHDLSKAFLGQPSNPRFVEFKDGEPLPKLKEEQPATTGPRI
jgi:hypothetical protein